ncbi:MAG: hypothetical protein RR063_12115 [Anaerovoracaceae bacterium]
MVIRSTPKDILNYIVADSDLADTLQRSGFHPKYMDMEYLYFIKTDKIVKFMTGGGK